MEQLLLESEENKFNTFNHRGYADLRNKMTTISTTSIIAIPISIHIPYFTNLLIQSM